MARVTREQVMRALSRTTVVLHLQSASTQGVIRQLIREGIATTGPNGRVTLLDRPRAN